MVFENGISVHGILHGNPCTPGLVHKGLANHTVFVSEVQSWESEVVASVLCRVCVTRSWQSCENDQSSINLQIHGVVKCVADNPK